MFSLPEKGKKNHVTMPTDLNITTWSSIIQGIIFQRSLYFQTNLISFRQNG